MTRSGYETKEALAIKMLMQNKTAAEVAAHKKIDVHPSTVQRWAKKAGIGLQYPFNRHSTRDDLIDVDEILRLHGLGVPGKKGKRRHTLQQIADMMGCSRSYVKQVVAKSRKQTA